MVGPVSVFASHFCSFCRITQEPHVVGKIWVLCSEHCTVIIFDWLCDLKHYCVVLSMDNTVFMPFVRFLPEGSGVFVQTQIGSWTL